VDTVKLSVIDLEAKKRSRSGRRVIAGVFVRKALSITLRRSKLQRALRFIKKLPTTSSAKRGESMFLPQSPRYKISGCKIARNGPPRGPQRAASRVESAKAFRLVSATIIIRRYTAMILSPGYPYDHLDHRLAAGSSSRFREARIPRTWNLSRARETKIRGLRLRSRAVSHTASPTDRRPTDVRLSRH